MKNILRILILSLFISSIFGADLSQKYDQLLELASNEKEKNPKRAQAAFELGKLHEKSEGGADLLGMREYYSYALELDPSRNDIKVLLAELEIKMTPKLSLKEKVKKAGVFGKVGVGYEHNSNVINEAVNPTAQSNKEDQAFLANFMIGKTWNKVKEIGQTSVYIFSLQDYTDLDSYDVSTHTILHSLSYDSIVKTSLDFSHTWVNVDDAHLMNIPSMNLGFSADLLKNLNSQIKFTLKDTTYMDSTLSGREGKGLGSKVIFNWKSEVDVRAVVGFLTEDLNDMTLAYDQIDFRVRLSKNVDYKYLTSIKLNGIYQLRDYDATSGGLAFREDDKFTLSLALTKVCDSHSITLEGTLIDNDSTRATNTYEKESVTLNYGYNF